MSNSLTGWLRVAAAFLLTVAGASGLFAQGLGTIVGTITDPSGGVIPSAKIRITDEGTSQTRETTANPQGYYVFPSLRPSS
jgi:hypothetical protein